MHFEAFSVQILPSDFEASTTPAWVHFVSISVCILEPDSDVKILTMLGYVGAIFNVRFDFGFQCKNIHAF